MHAVGYEMKGVIVGGGTGSPYAPSKAGADLLVRAYFRTYRFPVIITRCTNDYGPYQNPEAFIPLIITRALQPRDIPVYGGGRQVRDWIHVMGHGAGLVAAPTHTTLNKRISVLRCRECSKFSFAIFVRPHRLAGD